MAYHAGLKQVVVFGGYGGGPHQLGDTWTFQDGMWSQQQPGQSPPYRSGPAMAYDRARDRVVMFGGLNDTLGFLRDTWRWDGTTWTEEQLAVSPPSRFGRGDGL